MFDEPFAAGASWLHRTDPRCRVLAAVAGSCCFSTLHNFGAAGIALGLAVFLLLSSRPPFLPLVRRLLAVNVFLLFLWITVSISPGALPEQDILAAWKGFAVSRQGVDLCVLVTLKSNAIFLLFLALVATMSTPTLGHVLEKLRVPGKLVFLFLFTYRYVHVVAGEWRRLSSAARLRGFSPGNNLRTYRVAGYILGMLLARSHIRSRRVYEAMLLRGFSGHFFSVAGFTSGIRDIFFLLLMLLAFGLVLLAEHKELAGVWN